MLDARLRPRLDPFLDRLADLCIKFRLTANALSVIGFGFGLISGLLIMQEFYRLALLCLLFNRLCDGLDGAVARKSGATDFGGYLDIVLDFLFYALIPFSFAVANPDNALASCFLLFSFIGTGSSFLAHAILQAKHPRQKRKSPPQKSFFYLGGLTEGTETILFLILICVFPSAFIMLAYGFGFLCWLTVCQRLYITYSDFALK